MLRTTTTAMLALTSMLAVAQTRFTVSNVTITEKDNVREGTGATAMIKGYEGSDRVVIYADQNITIKTWVKVSTHNVRRSSLKDGAVNAIFEIDLIVDGKKDNRRVEKIFYGEDERVTRFTEKFIIKRGTTVRVITVAFDGKLE